MGANRYSYLLYCGYETQRLGASRRGAPQDGLPLVPPRPPPCARAPAPYRDDPCGCHPRARGARRRPVRAGLLLGVEADLDRQVRRLATWAARHHLQVERTEAEVGSGLSGRRKRLLRLLVDPTVSAIVVEGSDRVARFGWNTSRRPLPLRGGVFLLSILRRPLMISSARWSKC